MHNLNFGSHYRDYRWADFPARGYIVPHPHDVSVQTFRGHTVLQTLIRAYFSPAHSTGQRFVYTGSADGTVRIYGTLYHFLPHVLLSHMVTCNTDMLHSAATSCARRKLARTSRLPTPPASALCTLAPLTAWRTSMASCDHAHVLL